MKIQDLSKATGFGVSTVYDYLRSGLLHAPKKHGPTKSFFDVSHIDRLCLIRKFKDEDKLSKEEIKEKLSPGDTDLHTLKNHPRNVKILLIDKALELFSENGYEHTRISDITDSLNMGSGTFYRFFGSKEELLCGCMDRLPKVLIPKQAWAKVRKEKDYIKRLRSRGHAMMNAFPSYIGILNHVKLMLGHENKDIANKAAECLQNVVKPLKDEMSYAIKEGAIRPVDEDLVPFILLGINSIYGDRMLVDSKYTVDEAFSVIEDFVYHALVNRETAYRDRWTNIQLTLCSGDVVVLRDLCFNSQKNIEGLYKSGELSIEVNDMKVFHVTAQSDGVEIELTDVNDETYLVRAKADIVISGKISNSIYRVTLDKVKHILFD